MTKNTYAPYSGYMSFHRQTNAIKLAALVLIFLLGFTPKTYAVLVTHEWQESHRGYSIELIPGTGGTTSIPAEYAAAGTVYDATNHPGQAGWHFMRLDANGNILNSRIAWSANQSFRVVDIAAENGNAFRITIQAINTLLTPRNYVYIHGVDKTGADLPTGNNPCITIGAPLSIYQALYPTHSFCDGNDLYMIGYATHSPTGNPQEDGPFNYTTDKVSWIMKVTLNGTATVSRYAWNSVSGNNGTDYDMPLRIAPYSPYSTFPLLVTGAMNNGDGGSAIYIGKFDNNLTNTANGVLFKYPDFFGILSDNRWGYYGIDVRGDVGLTNDIVILTNTFDYIEEVAPAYCPTCDYNTWGITRIKDDLTVYGAPSTPNNFSIMLKIRPNPDNTPSYRVEEWANQFLEMHYTSGGSGEPWGDHIYVVGQKTMRPSCGVLPPGSLLPSITNVNPIITKAEFGTGVWNSTNGFLGTPAISGSQIFLSSKGTTTSNLDYYNGTLTTGLNGSALEDVRRLYTFASLEKHYGSPSTPPSNPGLIAPVGEAAPATNNNLLTRFIGTASLGSTYVEPQCQKTVQDCNNDDVRRVTFNKAQNIGTILEENISLAIYTSPQSLEGSTYIPSIKSCNTGYYKSTTSISNVEHVDAIKLYPNPTSTELNIELPGILTSKDAFEFKLVEMTGKTVYTNDNPAVGQSVLRFTLPQLAPGVYFGIVTLNGKQFSHKVTIQ